MRTSISGPWDHALIQSQTLNLLSHPGIQILPHFKIYFQVIVVKTLWYIGEVDENRNNNPKWLQWQLICTAKLDPPVTVLSDRTGVCLPSNFFSKEDRPQSTLRWIKIMTQGWRDWYTKRVGLMDTQNFSGIVFHCSPSPGDSYFLSLRVCSPLGCPPGYYLKALCSLGSMGVSAQGPKKQNLRQGFWASDWRNSEEE